MSSTYRVDYAPCASRIVCGRCQRLISGGDVRFSHHGVSRHLDCISNIDVLHMWSHIRSFDALSGFSQLELPDRENVRGLFQALAMSTPHRRARARKLVMDDDHMSLACVSSDKRNDKQAQNELDRRRADDDSPMSDMDDSLPSSHPSLLSSFSCPSDLRGCVGVPLPLSVACADARTLNANTNTQQLNNQLQNNTSTHMHTYTHTPIPIPIPIPISTPIHPTLSPSFSSTSSPFHSKCNKRRHDELHTHVWPQSNNMDEHNNNIHDNTKRRRGCMN